MCSPNIYSLKFKLRLTCNQVETLVPVLYAMLVVIRPNKDGVWQIGNFTSLSYHTNVAPFQLVMLPPCARQYRFAPEICVPKLMILTTGKISF